MQWDFNIAKGATATNNKVKARKLLVSSFVSYLTTANDLLLLLLLHAVGLQQRECALPSV